LVGLGLGVMVSCLQSRNSSAWATPPVHFCSSYYGDQVHKLFAWAGLPSFFFFFFLWYLGLNSGLVLEPWDLMLSDTSQSPQDKHSTCETFPDSPTYRSRDCNSGHQRLKDGEMESC
jgi:hypothetical protein